MISQQEYGHKIYTPTFTDGNLSRYIKDAQVCVVRWLGSVIDVYRAILNLLNLYVEIPITGLIFRGIDVGHHFAIATIKHLEREELISPLYKKYILILNISMLLSIVFLLAMEYRNPNNSVNRVIGATAYFIFVEPMHTQPIIYERSDSLASL